MSKTKLPAKEQVMAIFREIVGERAVQLAATTAIPDAQAIITKALRGKHGEEIAHDIAFHLTDWQSDAAFIVAMLLFPERFTRAQIREGVLSFAIHAPNHVAAAAKLCDFPVRDIFEIGVLDATEHDT